MDTFVCSSLPCANASGMPAIAPPASTAPHAMNVLRLNVVCLLKFLVVCAVGSEAGRVSRSNHPGRPQPRDVVGIIPERLKYFIGVFTESRPESARGARRLGELRRAVRQRHLAPVLPWKA